MTKVMSKEQEADGGREMKTLHSASLASETIPNRILLAPWGQVESTNGSFVVDDEAARMAVEAFEDHGTDLPIDFEHQTLGGVYASPTGQAPAAGWIKNLLAESGVGLIAEIEWTDQARGMLAAKQYRYLSPVAIIRKNDRKLVAIHSAALTNKPAIVGMKPIVNRAGLADQSTELEPLAVLRSELDLSIDAAAEEVLVAASRRLAELERDARHSRIDARIQEAMRAGKLVEAQRTWAEALVAKEEGLFDEWLRTAPVIVAPGLTAAPNAVDSKQRRHQAVATRARSEFRSNRFLSGVTSEEAFIAEAVRQATA